MTNIRNLEQFYFDILQNIIFGEDVITDLKKIEDNISNRYEFYNRKWGISNKLIVAAERLVRFHIYKNFGLTDLFASPLSSDIAFYLNNCLINIDIKTTNLITNPFDSAVIICEPNQISFKNIDLFARDEIGFKGIRIKPNLPAFDPIRGLPTLTYFISIMYNDDGEKFSLGYIQLCCLPNGKVVKEDFNNNMITGIKDYKYIGIELAKKLGKQYTPLSQLPISRKLLEFELTDRITAYLDKSIRDPYHFDLSYVLWARPGKPGSQFKILTGANQFRVNVNNILRRKNDFNQDWEGVILKQWNILSS